MALVRCTCVLSWTPGPTTPPVVEVQVLDPECAYVVHRAAAGALDPSA